MLGWLPGANGRPDPPLSATATEPATTRGTSTPSPVTDSTTRTTPTTVAARSSTTVIATAGCRRPTTTSTQSATTPATTSRSTGTRRPTGRFAIASSRRSWVPPTRTGSTCTRRRPTAARTRSTSRTMPTIWDSLERGGPRRALLLQRLPVHGIVGRHTRRYQRALRQLPHRVLPTGSLPRSQLRRPAIHHLDEWSAMRRSPARRHPSGSVLPQPGVRSRHQQPELGQHGVRHHLRRVGRLLRSRARRRWHRTWIR